MWIIRCRTTRASPYCAQISYCRIHDRGENPKWTTISTYLKRGQVIKIPTGIAKGWNVDWSFYFLHQLVLKCVLTTKDFWRIQLPFLQVNPKLKRASLPETTRSIASDLGVSVSNGWNETWLRVIFISNILLGKKTQLSYCVFWCTRGSAWCIHSLNTACIISWTVATVVWFCRQCLLGSEPLKKSWFEDFINGIFTIFKWLIKKLSILVFWHLFWPPVKKTIPSDAAVGLDYYPTGRGANTLFMK